MYSKTVVGSSYDDNEYENTQKFIDCSDSSSSACNDVNSVIIGLNTYNGGWNAVHYRIQLDQKAACIDNNLTVEFDRQVNGPDSTKGWSNGSSVSETTTGEYSALLVSAWDWNEDGGKWNYIDANAKFNFNSGNAGTIRTVNDGTGWYTDILHLVINGTVAVSGRSGTFLQPVQNDESKSELQLRFNNQPNGFLSSSRTDHLRTEIRHVNVSYDDEGVLPTNPSGDYEISSYGPKDFVNGSWTSTDRFTFEKDVAAFDACDFDELEYMLLPNGNGPPSSTSTPLSRSNAKTLSPVTVPSALGSGQFQLWYRAVDVNGNKADWSTDSSFVIYYDNVDPIRGSTYRNYPSSGWFSESHMPNISWANWRDTHSSIAYYKVHMNNDLVGNLSNTTGAFTIPSTSTSSLFCGTNNAFKLTAYDHALPTPNEEPFTLNVQFDNCDPTAASITLPASGWYTTNSPLVSFQQASEPSSQSGVATCEVAIGNVSQLSIPLTTCLNGGNFGMLLADGAHFGHIRTCDVAGNCANGTQKILRVDSVPPTLQTSIVRSPTQNVWSQDNDLNVTLSFSDPNPYGVQTSGMSAVYAGVFSSSVVPSSSQVQSAGYSTSCGSSTCTLDVSQSLTDGNHSLWYLAKDAAGNLLGPNKLAGSFLVDSVGPSAVTPYFASNITNLTTMNVLWVAAQDSHSGVSGYVLNLTSSGQTSSTTASLGSVTNHTLTGLTDGSYSVCLTPVDAAQNYGAPRCSSTSLVVDTTAPTLQASSDVASGWTTSNRVNITWQAFDSSSTAQVRYKLDNASFSQPFPTNHTVQLASLSAGLHHVLVKANDSAGNVREVMVSFGVDNAGPNIVASHDLGPLWTNQTQHSLTWNVTDVHSGIESISLYQSGTLIATNLSANGSWAFNLTAGVHNLSLMATDNVGHESWWTTNARVDTATPSVSCLVSPAGWSNSLPLLYLNISANGSLSNVAHIATYDGALFSAPSSGWHSLPSSVDGVHTVSVTVSNQGGNSAACEVNVYYDTGSPVFLAPPQLPQATSASLLNLNVSVDDVHAGVVELIWEVDNITLQASSSTTALLNISAFSEGTRDVRITAIDGAVNQRTWASSFILDRTAPSVDTFELENPLHNGWLNQSTATVHIEASDNLDNNVDTALFVNGVAVEYSGSSSTFTLPEGESTVAFHVTDHAGLTASRDIRISVDTTVPTCVLTSEIDSATWFNQTNREVTIIAEGGFSGHDVEFYLNNALHADQESPYAVSLKNGINTLDARIQSTAGLSSICSLGQLLDNVQDLVVVEVSESEGKYGDGLVEVNFSTSTNGLSNGTLQLFVNDEPWFNGSYIGDYLNSATFNLPTGVHVVSIQTKDEAGNNHFSEQISVLVEHDHVPPTVSCSYEDVRGTRVQLMEGVSEISVVEMYPALGTERNKIVCDASDGNPLSFEDGTGSATITLNGVSSQQGKQGGTVIYLLEPFGIVPSDKMHVFDVTVEDMWGNRVVQSYNVLFIDPEREASIACVSDDDVVKISGPKCDVLLPKFDSNEGPRLLLGADRVNKELGSSYEVRIDGEKISLSDAYADDIGKEGFTTIHLYDLLDRAGWEKFSMPFTVQFRANSSAGKSLSDSIEIEFSACEHSDFFSANFTTMTCQPIKYIGPTFSINSTVNEVLNSGTEKITLRHETPFNQHGKSSLCIIDGNEERITPPDGQLDLPLNEGQNEIVVRCTDAFGFTNTQTINLTWETTERNGGMLEGLSRGTIVVGTAIVIAFLAAVVLLLLLLRSKKDHRLSLNSGTGMDDGIVLVSSSSSTDQNTMVSAHESELLETEDSTGRHDANELNGEDEAAIAPMPESMESNLSHATNEESLRGNPQHPSQKETAYATQSLEG